MKTCRICKADKPLDEFYQAPKMRDGFFSECKPCARAISLKWKNKNRARTRKTALDKYYADPAAAAKKSAIYYLENTDKLRTASRIYYAENVDHCRSRNRQWKSENKEQVLVLNHRYRAKHRGVEGTHGIDDIERIFSQQKGKCAVCRTPLGPNRHRDHIVPLSRGGSNWAKNIQLLCPPCNLSKNARDPVEFMQSVGFLC